MTKKKQREDVVVGHKVPHINHELPQEVGSILVSLPLEERRAYATALRKKGWTLTSIAKPLNLTRESIRQYAKIEVTEETQKKIANLPLPDVPSVPIVVSRYTRIPIEQGVMEQLKELYKKARMVRGKSQNNREEAEQFTRLLWEQVERGVTIYSIAQALGVTPSGLSFRLVRYGYTTSNGKSPAYNPMKHRSNNA